MKIYLIVNYLANCVVSFNRDRSFIVKKDVLFGRNKTHFQLSTRVQKISTDFVYFKLIFHINGTYFLITSLIIGGRKLDTIYVDKILYFSFLPNTLSSQ